MRKMNLLVLVKSYPLCYGFILKVSVLGVFFHDNVIGVHNRIVVNVLNIIVNRKVGSE